MARLKRYHFPGLFYHVMVRGVNAQNIFFSDRDRYKMLFLLQEGVERFGHQIHAFCFMDNHVHLLIQVGEVALSKIVQNLTARYAQFVNVKYSRVGHLFQGRFKAIIIEEGLYYKRLLRYIHMNPVRASIVGEPWEYIWSSHNVYMGQKKISWLTVDFGLSQFGRNKDESLKNYIVYHENQESLEELRALRSDFADGQLLGSSEFIELVRKNSVEEIKVKLPLKALLQAVCDTLEIEQKYVISPSQSVRASFARGVFSWIASQVEDNHIEEIASLINRDGSSVSSLISRFCLKNKDSPEIQEIVEKVNKKINEFADLQV